MTIKQLQPTLARLALLTSIAAGWPGPATALPSPDAEVPTVAPNDNRHPAGTLEGGTLTLALRAGTAGPGSGDGWRR